jgi:hypothetical protein
MNKIGVKTPRNGNDGGVIQPDAAWLPELSQGFASQAFTQQIVHNAPGRAVGTARRSGIMRSMRVLALAVEFAGLLCVVSRSGFATLRVSSYMLSLNSACLDEFSRSMNRCAACVSPCSRLARGNDTLSDLSYRRRSHSIGSKDIVLEGIVRGGI